MTPSLLALSLSNTFTKIGALAAFAGLIGIAVLSLLFFSQARELKRLREWAGRAPERSAELEQRVSAAAAARVQQPVPAVRPVPRAVPISARPPGAAPAATQVAAGAQRPPVPVPGQAVTAAGTLAGSAAPQSPPQGQPATAPAGAQPPNQPVPPLPAVSPASAAGIAQAPTAGRSLLSAALSAGSDRTTDLHAAGLRPERHTGFGFPERPSRAGRQFKPGCHLAGPTTRRGNPAAGHSSSRDRGGRRHPRCSAIRRRDAARSTAPHSAACRCARRRARAPHAGRRDRGSRRERGGERHPALARSAAASAGTGGSAPRGARLSGRLRDGRCCDWRRRHAGRAGLCEPSIESRHPC